MNIQFAILIILILMGYVGCYYLGFRKAKLSRREQFSAMIMAAHLSRHTPHRHENTYPYHQPDLSYVAERAELAALVLIEHLDDKKNDKNVQ